MRANLYECVGRCKNKNEHASYEMYVYPLVWLNHLIRPVLPWSSLHSATEINSNSNTQACIHSKIHTANTHTTHTQHTHNTHTHTISLSSLSLSLSLSLSPRCRRFFCLFVCLMWERWLKKIASLKKWQRWTPDAAQRPLGVSGNQRMLKKQPLMRSHSVTRHSQ